MKAKIVIVLDVNGTRWEALPKGKSAKLMCQDDTTEFYVDTANAFGKDIVARALFVIGLYQAQEYGSPQHVRFERWANPPKRETKADKRRKAMQSANKRLF